jgi:hypothetical protein
MTASSKPFRIRAATGSMGDRAGYYPTVQTGPKGPSRTAQFRVTCHARGRDAPASCLESDVHEVCRKEESYPELARRRT